MNGVSVDENGVITIPKGASGKAVISVEKGGVITTKEIEIYKKAF